MEVVELRLENTHTTISFYPDDTVDRVRQHIALAVNSHPDRMCIQVRGTFPATHYSTHPQHAMDLFLRLSEDGKTITKERVQVYTRDIRELSHLLPQTISLSDWIAETPIVRSLLYSDTEFREWRLLGVPEETSLILATTPTNVAIPPTKIPIPSRTSIFETYHSYPTDMVRVIIPTEEDGEAIRSIYTPFLVRDTPNNIELLRTGIEADQLQLSKLFTLQPPRHMSVHIQRARWSVPLVSSKFETQVRQLFEQIFYGMTVSKTTPYIGYFTSKSEGMRHKFFVTSPTRKTPLLNIPIWSTWLRTTGPAKATPTLVLYRGSARQSFDKIAITTTSITFSSYRESKNQTSLETIQADLITWFTTLDAVIPFLAKTDFAIERWKLEDMSVVLSYANSVKTFDLRRFPCVRTVFGKQESSFRFLRVDGSVGDVTPQELNARNTIVQHEGDTSVLQSVLGYTDEEANDMIERLKTLEDENVTFDTHFRSYPVITFTSNMASVTAVTNLDRMIFYTNVLRYILTSDTEELNAVCPRKEETTEATSVVALPTVGEEPIAEDTYDLGDMQFGLEEEAPPPPIVAAPVAPTKTTMNVKADSKSKTYFLDRLRLYNLRLFGPESKYTIHCEMKKQVIILTPDERRRIDHDYRFSYIDRDASESMEIEGGGLAICPPYWCKTDEIPLQADQLDEDGLCPECGEEPVKRDAALKYPGFKSSKAGDAELPVPCCYSTPRRLDAIPVRAIDDSYVLTTPTLDALRLGYIQDEVALSIKLPIDYTHTIQDGRMVATKTDYFRIGLGSARTTIPYLFGEKTDCKSPTEMPELTLQCSFAQTWTALGEGTTYSDQVVAGIQAAWDAHTLSPNDELEFVAGVFKMRVMMIVNGSVHCGFWTHLYPVASRTLLSMDGCVIGKATRKARGVKGEISRYTFQCNVVRDFAPESVQILQQLQSSACVSELVPTFDDIPSELAHLGYNEYEIIFDPRGRAQAVLVPSKLILPFHPAFIDPPKKIKLRKGYHTISESELPTATQLRETLAKTQHKGFHWVRDVYNSEQQLVEFVLASGFRVPFKPETGEIGVTHDVGELLETIRTHDENTLVLAKPNEKDASFFQSTLYDAEVFDFLLYSLSKDIQTDDWASVRTALIENKDTQKEIGRWLDATTHFSVAMSPMTFLSKIRTPCGQLTNEEACSSATLCGWKENACHTHIRSPDKHQKQKMLLRLTKSLSENAKQRSLLLDDRMFPFFSTLLYLEMPHEWITTHHSDSST